MKQQDKETNNKKGISGCGMAVIFLLICWFQGLVMSSNIASLIAIIMIISACIFLYRLHKKIDLICT